MIPCDHLNQRFLASYWSFRATAADGPSPLAEKARHGLKADLVLI
jgi:hypothetical protein